jgi:hypothetical protein
MRMLVERKKVIRSKEEAKKGFSEEMLLLGGGGVCKALGLQCRPFDWRVLNIDFLSSWEMFFLGTLALLLHSRHGRSTSALASNFTATNQDLEKAASGKCDETAKSGVLR